MERGSGLDMTFQRGTSTGLAWSTRGLYPNIQMNRLGTNWLFDVQAGVYRTQGVHPNISVLLQQNTEGSFGVGFSSIWLSDAQWSSASIRWTQQLENVSGIFFVSGTCLAECIFQRFDI